MWLPTKKQTPLDIPGGAIHSVDRTELPRLPQRKLHSLFDRMILARQNRHRGKLPVSILSIPLVGVHRAVVRLHELVLNRLREHSPATPAPHFLPTLVEHDEVVRHPVRKTQLHHSLRVVANVELELHSVLDIDGKRRRNRCGGSMMLDRFFARGLPAH